MEAIKRYIMPKDLRQIIYNMQTNTRLVRGPYDKIKPFLIEGKLL